MNPLCIIAVPMRDKNGWFAVYADAESQLFDSESPLGVSRDPLADAAKFFLGQGLDPRTPIALQHDCDGPVVRQSTLSEAARGAIRRQHCGPCKIPFVKSGPQTLGPQAFRRLTWLV
jgi:hypothetical protein